MLFCKSIVVTEDNFMDIIKRLKRTTMLYKFNNWYKCVDIEKPKEVTKHPGIIITKHVTSKSRRDKNGNLHTKFISRPRIIMNNTFLDVRKHYTRQVYEDFMSVDEKDIDASSKMDIDHYNKYKCLIWIGTGVDTALVLCAGDTITFYPFNIGFIVIDDNKRSSIDSIASLKFYNSFIRLPIKINFNKLLREREEQEEALEDLHYQKEALMDDEVYEYDEDYWGDENE